MRKKANLFVCCKHSVSLLGKNIFVIDRRNANPTHFSSGQIKNTTHSNCDGSIVS